jgi:hypothetical protein
VPELLKDFPPVPTSERDWRIPEGIAVKPCEPANWVPPSEPTTSTTLE